MSTEKNDFDELADHVEEYIETKIELIKLQAVEKSSTMLGSLAAGLIVLLFALTALVFASFSLAYALSEWIGVLYSGFAIVACMYLLLALLFYVNRTKWIIKPFQESFIENYFDDRDES